ncbi:MAG: nucleotide exchange factor GrpE [Gammaproteobacteria bacterium]|nr:nucleotide exchange factor GrpE [Gammaproteobacteria bacterium]
MSSKKDKESHAHTGSTASLHQKLHGEGADTDSSELLTKLSYEEMQEKLTETEQKATQHWERVLRMQAEHDNALRRAERDVTNAHKYGIEKFVSELLPIIDNMERSLQIPLAEEGEGGDSGVIEGVKLTLKMFYAALEKFGVQQVDPTGAAFNPDLHQAVSVQVDTSVAPGTVLNVLQKGYQLNNRLIRPAFVVVAKADVEK